MNSFNILQLNPIVDYHRIGQTLSVIFSKKSFCLWLSDLIDNIWLNECVVNFTLQTFQDNQRFSQTLSVKILENVILSVIVWCDRQRLSNLFRLLRIFTDFRRILPTAAVRAQASSVIIGENRRDLSVGDRQPCQGTDKSDFHRLSKTKWTLSKCLSRIRACRTLIFYWGHFSLQQVEKTTPNSTGLNVR